MIKKKVIIYSTRDKYITLPLLEDIFTNTLKHEKIDLYLNKPKFFHKLKILCVFFFFSPLNHFKILFKYKKKVDLSRFKNVKIINKEKLDYKYGFSINYTNKIKIQKFKIFNFHLGNFSNQRGSFGYFYKFKYNWKYMDLTFHLIDKNWDKGRIINKKRISVKKLSAIEICTLYKRNYDFITENIRNVLTKKIKYLPTNYGKLNITPSYHNIFKTYFIKRLLKLFV